MPTITVYVHLRNEGIDCWRPTQAMEFGQRPLRSTAGAKLWLTTKSGSFLRGRLCASSKGSSVRANFGVL